MENLNDLSPNHTQIPNDYLDMFMAHLTGAEWKCLCYIARRTFGFQKRADQIAFSQFEKGIKTKDGKVLDYGTGLSRPKISESLQRLIEIGLLESKDKGNSKEYLLVKKINQLEVVKKINQTGKETLPKVVKKVNIQKKEKESIQNKEGYLPEWLDKIAWKEWEQHRKELGKKLTPTTIRRQISFLEKNMRNHVSIINRSITQGWTGLFEIKNDKLTSNNDAVRKLEKMRIEQEEIQQRNESFKNNEMLRKTNDILKTLSDSKKV